MGAQKTHEVADNGGFPKLPAGLKKVHVRVLPGFVLVDESDKVTGQPGSEHVLPRHLYEMQRHKLEILDSPLNQPGQVQTQDVAAAGHREVRTAPRARRRRRDGKDGQGQSEEASGS